MLQNKDIFEKIGLTAEEAKDCWDHDCVNDMDGSQEPAEVLKDIISDKELSVEQKVYLTWIYAYPLDKKREMKKIEDNAW